MNRADAITALSALWCDLVRLDHHKDRDCHWSLEINWSYGQPPTYHVLHNGYAFRVVALKADRLEDAERMLIAQLVRATDEQLAWAQQTLSDGDATDAHAARSMLDLRPRFEAIKAELPVSMSPDVTPA